MAKSKSTGRFTKVGEEGEDFLPELPMEHYMNFIDIPILTGAAGVAVVDTVNTGLQLENLGDQAPWGVKWVLYGGIYGPADAAAYAAVHAAAASTFVMMQLQRGLRVIADLKTRDHDDVIGMGGINWLGQGSTVVFPQILDLLDPIPVLAKRLSVITDISNDANVNSLNWNLRLRYGIAAVTDSDHRALLQLSLED